jgi:hypothetical protein
MDLIVILVVLGLYITAYFVGKYLHSIPAQQVAERVSKRPVPTSWQLRLELRDLRRELAQRDNEIRFLRRRLNDVER